MSDTTSYDFLERGDYSGQDIRLYKFTISGISTGSGGMGETVWAYTNNDRNVTWGGTTYHAVAIGDDGLKQKGDATTDDFVVTMPSSLAPVTLFRGTPPAQPIKAELRMLQMGATGYNDAPLMWFGYVSSVKFKDEIVSTVLCNTQTATLNRKGLRLAYERQCPHALYDSQCRVNKDEWGVLAVVSAQSRNWIGVILPAPGSTTDTGISRGGHAVALSRMLNGFIEWDTGEGYADRRAILTPYLGGFVLLGLTDGLSIGLNILLYPGCRRTPDDCRAFNNIPNYGGFPFLPGKSPFDGDPVF